MLCDSRVCTRAYRANDPASKACRFCTRLHCCEVFESVCMLTPVQILLCHTQTNDPRCLRTRHFCGNITLCHCLSVWSHFLNQGQHSKAKFEPKTHSTMPDNDRPRKKSSDKEKKKGGDVAKSKVSKKKKRDGGESFNVNASSRGSKSARSSVKGRHKKSDESTDSDDSVDSAVSGRVENVDSDAERSRSELREQRRIENEAHSSSVAASARSIKKIASLAPENGNVSEIQSFLSKNNMTVSQLQEIVDRGRLGNSRQPVHANVAPFASHPMPVSRSVNARAIPGHSSSLR